MLKSHSGSKHNYIAEFTNIDNTDLKANNAVELVWATETLEAYGVIKKDDYPSESTVFSDIDLETEDDKTPTVKWSAVSNPKDNIKTTINKQGSKDAKITIKY